MAPAADKAACPCDLGRCPGKEVQQHPDSTGRWVQGADPYPAHSETAQYHFLQNPQPGSAT